MDKPAWFQSQILVEEHILHAPKGNITQEISNFFVLRAYVCFPSCPKIPPPPSTWQPASSCQFKPAVWKEQISVHCGFSNPPVWFMGSRRMSEDWGKPPIFACGCEEFPKDREHMEQYEKRFEKIPDYQHCERNEGESKEIVSRMIENFVPLFALLVWLVVLICVRSHFSTFTSFFPLSFSFQRWGSKKKLFGEGSLLFCIKKRRASQIDLLKVYFCAFAPSFLGKPLILGSKQLCTNADTS